MKRSVTFLPVVLLVCIHAFSSPYSPTGTELMRSNLYIAGADGTTTLADGDLTQYDPTFNNAIDGMDARKMSNFAENIGMIRGTTTLVIERRHTIQNTDTIFYKIWNLSKERKYQLEFDASNLSQPGLIAYLEDQYLHTNTPVSLDGTSYINFSINADAASSDAYRFRLIFTTVSKTLPVTFTATPSYGHNNAISLKWNTSDENDVKDYTVERSSDGINFKEMAVIKTYNAALDNYSYVDAYPQTGFNYYRLQGSLISGDTKYSDIIKVDIEKGISLVRAYPNPVINKTFNLQFVNEPAGFYQVKLVNNAGQPVITKQFQHQGGSINLPLTPMQNIPHGIYRLEIIQPDRTTANINVVY